MYKKLFTKNNFEDFLADNSITIDELAKLYKNDSENFIDILENLSKNFKDRFELPYQNFDIINVLLDAIDAKVDLNDFFIYEKEKKEVKNNFIKVITDNLNLKIWSKQKAVLNNLNKIISYLENLDKNNSDKLIKDLQLTADNYKVDGGNICSPKKYAANCNEKLPKGFTAIELRVNSDSSAEFRCFGFLKNNKIYLLTIDTKNDGQDKANEVFDKFISSANNYINKHNLNEEIMYNIIRGKIMEENIFDELDELAEQQKLSEYNNGWNDYFCQVELNEAICSDDYLHGYYDAKEKEEIEEIKKDMREHHDEIVQKIKDRIKLHDNN